MVEDKSLINKSVDSNDDDKYGLHPSKDIKCTWGNELFGKMSVNCGQMSMLWLQKKKVVRNIPGPAPNSP